LAGQQILAAAAVAGPGPQTFGNIGAGVSDIFAGFADLAKAQGDILEGQAYGEAAQLALQNEQYTKQSTAISGSAVAARALHEFGSNDSGSCRRR
jgi:hypothetical protein